MAGLTARAVGAGLVAGLAAAGGLLLLAGARTAEQATAASRGAARSRVGATVAAPLTAAGEPARAAAASAAPSGRGSGPAGEEPASAEPGLPELDAALAAELAARGRDDESAAELAGRERRRLIERLARDPLALGLALEAFRSAEGEAAGVLAAALGHLRDPAVEQLALELAAAGGTPALRAAAFDVLDALDSPGALGVALEALAHEPTAEVRRAALFALPPAEGASLEQAARVVRELAPRVGTDPDPEGRRRAVLALACWHTCLDDLGPVLAALARDPDPAVRAGAAFALERCARRDPRVACALAEALVRPGEARLVRENAWRALAAQGPLPRQEAQAYADYALERQGWIEAGGAE